MKLHWREQCRDVGLLVMRVGLGLMFVFVHGGPKLLDGPERWARLGGAMAFLGITFAPAFWGFCAAAAETFGGLLLAIGLVTRPALALMCFTMFVAVVMIMSRDGAFAEKLSRASHALELGIVFVALAFTGPGRHSLSERIPRLRRTWLA